MKIVVDTNVLVRSVMRDDPAQAAAADKVLKNATAIVITVPTLCEFAWVLRSRYRVSNVALASTIQALLDANNVITSRSAVEAGLAFLKAGGDFADGAIAHEGTWLGGETFISFDRKAVELAAAQGYSAQLMP